MNIFANHLLLFLGTVSLITGFYFFISERKDNILNKFIFILGILQFFWCLGYSIVGFSTTYTVAFLGRIIGFSGVVFFMTTELILLTYITKKLRAVRKYIISFMLLVSLQDIIIYLWPGTVSFIHRNGITIIRSNLTPFRFVHLLYLAFLITFNLYYCSIWIKETRFKREHMIVKTLVAVNLLILVGALPDTFLPMIGYETIPTSGFVGALAYLILVFFAAKYNIFTVSESNINSYIFNYAASPILVFNQNQELTMMNNYAKVFFHQEKVSNQKLSDLFEISVDSAKQLLDSLTQEQQNKVCRLVTKEDRTICVLTFSAVLDHYKDPYCTVCFAYDLSKEASILKEVNSMKAQLDESLEEKKLEMEKLTLQAITTIANTIDAKDKYTKGHSIRVAQYSALLAESLGWEDSDVQNLRYTALLHDIGKIGIPDVILNKPDSLSDMEYHLIESHTTTGGDILKDILMIPGVTDGATFHHERYDGTGYPEGLSGNDIPIVARIICIADSYDAMSSNRIYRNALPKQEIHDELLKGRGTQFDPVLLDAFITLLDADRLIVDDYNSTSKGDSLAAETTHLLGKIVTNLERESHNNNETDYLTGLLTRSSGEKQIASMLMKRPGCLAFLDLDNLKHVNDTLGHNAGDAAISLVGQVLTAHAHNAVISRIGGDEFLFFMPDADEQQATVIIEGILNSYQSRKEEYPTLMSTSLSVGLCLSSPADAFSDIYQKADKALYYVKQHGKGDYHFFTDVSFEMRHMSSADLTKLVSNIQTNGAYSGALNVEYREFTKIYDLLNNIALRYQHKMQFLMITLTPLDSKEEFKLEKQEKAMEIMEKEILSTLRNVDMFTRFSNVQFLLVLFNADEKSVDMVIHRIFEAFYQKYPDKDISLSYDIG